MTVMAANNHQSAGTPSNAVTAPGLLASCESLSEKCGIFRNMASSVKTATDLKARILARIKSAPDSVWTPADFADIASRAAVDKTLQRLAAGGDFRRTISNREALFLPCRQHASVSCRTLIS